MSIKKAIVIGLVLIAMFVVAPNNHYYAWTAKVTSIDKNLVTVVDHGRTIWHFWGSAGYKVGDVVSMLVYDSMTPGNVYDDSIIKVNNMGQF